jgi:hypothetical protein
VNLAHLGARHRGAVPARNLPRKWGIRLGVGLALIAIMAMSIVDSPWLRHQFALSFTRTPTRYTELYFGDYAAIPQTLSMSHPNRFQFTVHNREGKGVVYAYRVTATSRFGQETVGAGRLSAASGRTETVTVAFTPARPHTAYRVTVAIQRPRPETIDFTAQS